MTNLVITKNNKNSVSHNIQKHCSNNAFALVDALRKCAVEQIFGYPGASVLSVYNELSKVTSIKHYLVRHEQAAVHAAEGYARISGKTGVALVTSGPGFTNTITGIANAYADSTPLLILVGDVSSEKKNAKVFQNVDILSITKSCCKKCIKVSTKDNIAQIIIDAYNEANTGIKGPVIVALPRNILESEYINSEIVAAKNESTQKDFSKEITKLIKLINDSQKPLILVGGGALDASKEIIDFAENIKCPIISTLMGIGVYPSSDKKFLGMIGINGTYTANSALNQSDLIISLGVSFSDRSTCRNGKFAGNAKIVSVNLRKNNFKTNLEIIGDLKQVLNQFNEKIQYCNLKTFEMWNQKVDIFKEEGKAEFSTSKTLHSSFVLETLSDFTKNLEPVVVTDVGQHQMLTAQFFDFDKPRKFITSGGLGTMGFGLPAAIGAYTANPKNTVLNITGDGSFQMNLQELATCREHNIPIKIIILNNSSLGMVRQLQEKIYSQCYQVEMINPDFTKIAEAYDLFAISVKTKQELIPALKKALEHNGTAIVDIVIDEHENI